MGLIGRLDALSQCQSVSGLDGVAKTLCRSFLRIFLTENRVALSLEMLQAR